MRAKQAMRTVPIHFTTHERRGLIKAAAKLGISKAELVRRLTDAYLGIESKPVEPVKFAKPVPGQVM
jgi:hypothetical protein